MNTTRIIHIEIMSDASGAPAVVESFGLRWRFDCLGEVKVERLGAGSGWMPRGEVTRSKAHAEGAYRAELARRTGPEWYMANRAMYRDA